MAIEKRTGSARQVLMCKACKSARLVLIGSPEEHGGNVRVVGDCDSCGTRSTYSMRPTGSISQSPHPYRTESYVARGDDGSWTARSPRHELAVTGATRDDALRQLEAAILDRLKREDVDGVNPHPATVASPKPPSGVEVVALEVDHPEQH